jgi:murein DD-endopeptidase MepM/ murein hydrolase activator NlpD
MIRLLLLILALITTTGCLQDQAHVEYKGDEFFGKDSTYGGIDPHYAKRQRMMQDQNTYQGIGEQVIQERSIQETPIKNEQQIKPQESTIPDADHKANDAEDLDLEKELSNSANQNQISTESIGEETINKPKSTGSVKELSWPVEGKIITQFGLQPNKVKNDGINIAAPAGTAVKAAADGTVIYSGNGLGGYGNLVLIKHKNGLFTAYAHQESISVKNGTLVKRGQVIGKVGKTGNVKSPQLHFAVRQGKKPVDPMLFLE